jgi:peptidoglycan/LPS O-acetylase OafA/YrhL
MKQTHPPMTLFNSWKASAIYAHAVNFHHHSILTVVTWTLEIEVQLYLLAPLIARILKFNIQTRRAIIIVAIFTILGLQSVYNPPFMNLYNYLQYFLIGILLADIYISNNISGGFNKNWVTPMSVLLLWLSSTAPLRTNFHNEFLNFCVKLIFPFLIGLFYLLGFKQFQVEGVF